MIIAMDPKRNRPPDDKITLNSVFSLHSKKHGRETNRNDYWNFIEPLLKNNFIYITDAYKFYYDTYDEVNGKINYYPSNKDKSFTGIGTRPYILNKSILEGEIAIIKPNKIITLGNQAASSVKLLKNIKETGNLTCEENGIEYIFMPHISRTVTQKITTIANLLITLGMVKNHHRMTELGLEINNLRANLYK